MVYNGRKDFNLLSIPTFRAIFGDKLLIWIVQLKCSSICIPRNVVNFSIFILLPFIIISALSVLKIFTFGVNIMKLDILTFNVSLLVLNHNIIAMFLKFNINLFYKSVEIYVCME